MLLYIPAQPVCYPVSLCFKYIHCPYGYVKDKNGCDTCFCKSKFVYTCSIQGV